MTALDLIVGLLATWRLAYFLVKDRGPFNFMLWIRVKTDLGGLLTCLYCASIWTGLIMYLSLLYFPAWAWLWAFSGGAMMLWRYTGGVHGES